MGGGRKLKEITGTHQRVNIRKADALTIISYKKLSFCFIILLREVESGRSHYMKYIAGKELSTIGKFLVTRGQRLSILAFVCHNNNGYWKLNQPQKMP